MESWQTITLFACLSHQNFNTFHIQIQKFKCFHTFSHHDVPARSINKKANKKSHSVALSGNSYVGWVSPWRICVFRKDITQPTCIQNHSQSTRSDLKISFCLFAFLFFCGYGRVRGNFCVLYILLPEINCKQHSMEPISGMKALLLSLILAI
jgi:hypothetical protein